MLANQTDFRDKRRRASWPRRRRRAWCSSATARVTPGWLSRSPARSRRAARPPFLDEADIDKGADFEEEIVAFLEKAHELVVLLTPWSMDRPYVWAELGAAWSRRIPVVALLLGITPGELQARPGVPVFLKKRNLLELNDIGEYLKELQRRIRKRDGA